MKICILGDSVSKGVQLDEITERYYCGKNGFADRLAGDGIEVQNHSVFGCTVTKGLQLAHRHQSNIEDANIVLIEIGGNDSDYKWKEIAENPNGEYVPNTTPACYLEDYSKLIDEIKNMGSKPVIMNLPPIHAKRYFDWFSKGMSQEKKQNIIDWLGGDIEYIHRWHKMYNDKLCGLAASLGVPQIDIRSGFGGIEQYGQCICLDGIHPNDDGQKIIYESVKSFLL